jgi:hypothetical protein
MRLIRNAFNLYYIKASLNIINATHLGLRVYIKVS